MTCHSYDELIVTQAGIINQLTYQLPKHVKINFLTIFKPDKIIEAFHLASSKLFTLNHQTNNLKIYQQSQNVE